MLRRCINKATIIHTAPQRRQAGILMAIKGDWIDETDECEGKMLHFHLGFLVLLSLAVALLSSDSSLCGTESNKCDKLWMRECHILDSLFKMVPLLPGEGAGIWWCAVFPLPFHIFIFSENKWYKSRRWGRAERKREWQDKKKEEGRLG